MTTSVDFTQIPGVDNVVSWLSNLQNDFLALPNRMQGDLAGIQYLRSLQPNTSDGATLTQVESAINSAQSSWQQIAAQYQGFQQTSSGATGGPGIASVLNGVALAGNVAGLFYEVDNAEHQLDTVARSMLTSAQLTEYQNVRGGSTLSGVSTTAKMALAVGGGLLAIWLLGRR